MAFVPLLGRRTRAKRLRPMRERVTMADIACRANVHLSTVSMALRDHPHIAGATKERIKAIAAEMGFRPDPALRALAAYRHERAGRSHPAPIAYITRGPTRWGWKEHATQARNFAGALSESAKLGYALEHFWLGEPNLTPRRLNTILLSRGIRALIFASPHDSASDSTLDFDWSEFAAVTIDAGPAQPRLHAVSNDPQSAMRLAVQQAQAAGYRRPGLVLARSWDHCSNLGWSAGFLAMQLRFPASERVPVLLFGSDCDPAASDGAEATVPSKLLEDWLLEHRSDVIISHDAFFVGEDAPSRIAGRSGVPFIDLCLLSTTEEIAGVRPNSERIGELAVEMVAALLEKHKFGLPEIPSVTCVDGTWSDGASLPRTEASTARSPLIDFDDLSPRISGIATPGVAAASLATAS